MNLSETTISGMNPIVVFIYFFTKRPITFFEFGSKIIGGWKMWGEETFQLATSTVITLFLSIFLHHNGVPQVAVPLEVPSPSFGSDLDSDCQGIPTGEISIFRGMF